MSNLITLENVSLAYGLHPLLDHVKMQIKAHERVCLIGRNGAGKSSLLKIVEGSIQPDQGSVWRKPTLRLSRLAQELPQHTTSTIYEFVALGLADIGKLLADYHLLLERLAKHSTPDDLIKLEKLQNQIDSKNAWEFEQKIKTILERLELPADQLVNELSGGWQRRAALAQALVSSPELLLLDEPTNHLDISAIEWLEEQLLFHGTGLLFITHDRALLKRLATRILELDRGKLHSWECTYPEFLERKEQQLHAEAKQNELFDKKLAQEEVWIRQGIKARRTRNEGRVRALYAMRKERAKRRLIQGKATFNVNEGSSSGQLVIEAKNVTHYFNDLPVIKDFSIRIIRGDRIGLIGPNGVGKSTLLNILLGNLTPQEGTVTQGTKLQIAYFDQMRASLDPDKTVKDNVCEGSDTIELNDKKQHVISYLNDFLFTPDRALTKVKALSGGECNRLLLAKLFSKPANLLVMDEPTNDLDIETLELLEEILNEYQGTILLVSHDRAFLDHVVTSTLVFEGKGKIEEFIGGYEDWLTQKKQSINDAIGVDKDKKTYEKNKSTIKLSYKEQKELDELPQKIEKLENLQNNLQQIISDSSFYKKNNNDEVTQTLAKLNQIEMDLKTAYERWNELEERIKK